MHTRSPPCVCIPKAPHEVVLLVIRASPEHPLSTSLLPDGWQSGLCVYSTKRSCCHWGDPATPSPPPRDGDNDCVTRGFEKTYLCLKRGPSVIQFMLQRSLQGQVQVSPYHTHMGLSSPPLPWSSHSPSPGSTSLRAFLSQQSLPQALLQFPVRKPDPTQLGLADFFKERRPQHRAARIPI